MIKYDCPYLENIRIGENGLVIRDTPRGDLLFGTLKIQKITLP